jgi:hypothetical protein
MSVTFTCYFPAAENPRFMTIDLLPNAWVMHLLKGIEVELHSRGHRDVKLDDLRLYKVNLFFLRRTAN